MARDISSLCAERHYMGSSSSARYATDRSVRPDYVRLPSPEDLLHSRACRAANLTRYVRNQDVLWWVCECQDAKVLLNWGNTQLDRIKEQLEAGDLPQERRDALERAAAHLRQLADSALARRKEASRQLRLIGISPKAQAEIVRELERRQTER